MRPSLKTLNEQQPAVPQGYAELLHDLKQQIQGAPFWASLGCCIVSVVPRL